MILGGTSEATHLSKLVALAKINATLSFAGRVKRTKPQPIPIRVGGFGGPEGLCDYIVQNKITHVIDATHPFAEQISWNTFKACTDLRIPFAALTRNPWVEEPGDSWKNVDSVKAAAIMLKSYNQEQFSSQLAEYKFLNLKLLSSINIFCVWLIHLKEICLLKTLIRLSRGDPSKFLMTSN